MKRSSFFISVLALAASSAMAQSTVNISGTVDAGVSKRTGQAAKLQSDGSRASQITFSGQEDLGTGLKATFLLSGYIDASTGHSDGLAKRNAYVGLESTQWGAVRFGRSYNPLYTHALTASGEYGVESFQTIGTTLTDQGRVVSNQISYMSPAWRGLTGTFSYGFSEEKDLKDAVGLGIRYEGGPLAATYVASRTTTNFPGTDSKYIQQLGAGYDFGVMRLLGTVQHDPNLVDHKLAYSVGFTAPIGRGTAWASYDHRQMVGDNLNVVQAGYKYDLSKRTQLYGQVAYRNRSTNLGINTHWGPWPLGGIGTNDSTGYGVGLSHSF